VLVKHCTHESVEVSQYGVFAGQVLSSMHATQACIARSQTGPFDDCAQSALDLQLGTQACTRTSHVMPPPPQSAAATHATQFPVAGSQWGSPS
jgi:hypothetical protein